MEKIYKSIKSLLVLSLAIFCTNTWAQVGIGTTSPNRMLDVRGDIAMGTWTQNFPSRRIGVMDGSLHVAGLEIENTALGGTYSQKLHLLTHEFGATFGRRFSIDEKGNVGIGVENPNSRLHINRTNAGNWIVGNLGSDAGGERLVLGLLGGKATIGGHTNDLSAWTDLVINPSATNGNVGIGTNAPTTKLDVNGKIKATSLQITNGATDGWVLRSDAAGNASWSFDRINVGSINYLPRWNGSMLVSSR